MNIFRPILFISLSLGLFKPCFAQSDNVWVVDGTAIGFKMDFRLEPPVLTSLPDVDWFRSSRKRHQDKVTVVDEKGDLQYYTRHNGFSSLEVFDKNDNLLFKNQIEDDSIQFYTSSFIFQTKDTITIISQVERYDRRLLQLLRTDYEINSDYRRSSTWIEGYSQPTGEVGDTFSSEIFMSRIDGVFHFFYSIGHLYKVGVLTSDNKLIELQSFKINCPMHHSAGPGYSDARNRYNSSHNKIHLLHPDKDSIGEKGNLRIRNYGTFSFSSGSGITSFEAVYQNREFNIRQNGDVRNKEELADVVSSPNDSFTYLLNWNYYTERQLIKLRGSTEIDRISLPFSYHRMKLGPNGKIYMFPYWVDKSVDHTSYIGVVENPDEDGKIAFSTPDMFELNRLSDKDISGFEILVVPSFSGIHKQVKFEADTACSGLFSSFYNLSDSNHFEKFRFYFGDGDSAEIDNANNILIAGQNNIKLANQRGVQHKYTSPGKYFVKLRAFTDAGGWVWFSDSVLVVEPSEPRFSVKDTTGCQWLAYQIQDLSKVVNKGKDIVYNWTFGDGTDSTEINPRTNTKQHKIYTTSGNYKIELTIKDGFCVDSFSLLNNVNILAAPQPGMVVSPTEGCEPVLVNVDYEHGDATDSIVYHWGDGNKVKSVFGKEDHVYQIYPAYLTTQIYSLTQRLYGPTGCVTSDTADITIHPGFYTTESPYLNLVTVNNDQSIDIHWDSFPGALGYALYKNGHLLDQTSSLKYTDATTNSSRAQNSYKITATNVCNEQTDQSNVGKNILLTGKGADNNKISVIKWTPYENWTTGVADYAIEVQNEDNTFTEIYRQNVGSQLEYKDLSFLESALDGFSVTKCYRIAAFENHSIPKLSYSNVSCVPYNPVIFIPSAFTPNADGLNDLYRPITFGVEYYTMKIFDRYGQKVAELDQNSEGWSAENYPSGTYIVSIQAKGTDLKIYNLNQTVTVLR